MSESKLHFSGCDRFTKTMQTTSIFLSLYGSALWLSSYTELRSLEVPIYNDILYRRSGNSLDFVTLPPFGCLPAS